MKCSYQSGYKFDQASLQLKVVMKLGDQYLSFSSVYHSRSPVVQLQKEGTRDDQ